MKKPNPAAAWEAASKRAYWDREVPLETWRERVRQGHPSYLPAAVAFLPADQFIRFFGTHRFALNWPAMRAGLPTAMAGKAGMLNLLWSRLVGGGWNLRPFPDYYLMPQERREFLTRVARVPGESISQAAEALHMRYRQAYGHASRLAGEGKIRIAKTVEGDRRRLKLFPAYG